MVEVKNQSVNSGKQNDRYTVHYKATTYYGVVLT